VNEILRGLLAYLSGDRPFVAFNEWLSDLAWSPAGRSQADIDLLREVELRVAEFTGGCITEDDLKNVIREIAGVIPRVVEILGRWRAPLFGRRSFALGLALRKRDNE
jgi:hypothetical protein